LSIEGSSILKSPSSGNIRNNPIVLTFGDYKRLVEEGVGIVTSVNESLDREKPTFQVVGDPHDPFMKLYWFKVKCLVCPTESLQLCPPNQNPEANLMNHIHGVVHAKSVERLK